MWAAHLDYNIVGGTEIVLKLNRFDFAETAARTVSRWVASQFFFFKQHRQAL
jgi:hypothetical protein